MWRLLAKRGATVLVLLAGGAGSAIATPTKKSAAIKPRVATQKAEALFDTDPKPTLTVQQDPQTLNRDEMISLARKLGNDLADALLDGERHREQAVRDKDSIKLACIQDRLSGMKLMKKVSDDRLTSLDRPSVRADDLRLRHEFRGVEMAHERVNELHRELLECVGESLEVTIGPGTDSRTTSTTVLDPVNPSTEMPKIERPIPASPAN